MDRFDAELRGLPEKTQHTEKEKRVAAWLDRGEGSCHLADPAIATIVEDSLLRNDGSRYRLLAWCVMPNHVHVLVEMANGWRLPDVVQAWKSFTAHEANVRLGREGAFWRSSSAWSGRVVANKAGEDAGAPSALSRAPAFPA